MNNFRISVLIPCYNQENHIRQTIEAIINQTYPPDEIIVVDDGSTDHSVELIKQLPIKLIQHETNKGPSIARNTALQHSSGEIIIYIDADAYADKYMIAALLKAYQFPHDGKLAGVTGRGIETHIESIYDRWRSLHAVQDFGKKMRDRVPFPFGLCMSFYRDKLLEIGGFDPYFPINAGEDYDIGLRLKKANYWLRYEPKAIVYHQHSDTEQKLKRIQYNWYYWGYLARKRAKDKPWVLALGALKRLFLDTMVDLILRHDLKLVKIDFEIFWIKMLALHNASFKSLN